jgi:hypothetical protein
MSDSVKCPLCHETFTDVDALALHQQRQVECLKHRLAEERERGDDAEAKNRRVLDAWLRERGRAEKAEAGCAVQREVVKRLLSVGKRAVSRPQDGEVVRDWLRAADAAKDLNPDPLPMRPTGQRRIVTQSKGA